MLRTSSSPFQSIRDLRSEGCCPDFSCWKHDLEMWQSGRLQLWSVHYFVEQPRMRYASEICAPLRGFQCILRVLSPWEWKTMTGSPSTLSLNGCSRRVSTSRRATRQLLDLPRRTGPLDTLECGSTSKLEILLVSIKQCTRRELENTIILCVWYLWRVGEDMQIV